MAERLPRRTGGGGGSSAASSLVTVAAAGASQTVTAGPSPATPVYDLTGSAATCTITLAGAAAGSEYGAELYLRQDATGNRAWAFSVPIQWVGNVVPSFSTAANAYDIVTLTTVKGGTQWSGSALVGFITPTAPSAPTSLNVTGGNTQNVLAWTQGAANGSAVTNNEIWRSTSAGAETLLTTIAANTTYTDTGLTNGTTYYYKIKAINAVGTSGFSSEASGAPFSAIFTENFPYSDGALTTNWSAIGTFNNFDVASNKAKPHYVATQVSGSKRAVGAQASKVTYTLTMSSVRYAINLGCAVTDANNRLEMGLTNSGSNTTCAARTVVGGAVTTTIGTVSTLALGSTHTVEFNLTWSGGVIQTVLVKLDGTTVGSGAYSLTSGEKTAFGSAQNVGMISYTDVSGGNGDDGGTLVSQVVAYA